MSKSGPQTQTVGAEGLAYAEARPSEVDIWLQEATDGVPELRFSGEGLSGRVLLSSEQAEQLAAEIKETLEQIE